MSFLIMGDEPPRCMLRTPRIIDTALLTGKPAVASTKKADKKAVGGAGEAPRLSKKEAASRELKARVSAGISALVYDKPTVAKIREYMEARVKELCSDA